MTQPHNGTSITDWEYYREQARDLSVDQLKHGIRDCQQAIQSGIKEANFPCKAEGFYFDLCSVYSEELRSR